MPSRLAARRLVRATRLRSGASTSTWPPTTGWLGDTDVAPYTGRRVPVLTTSDLAIEQSTGRDHAQQNTHRYDDPVRLDPEAVFDAISWARGQLDDPPSGY